MSFYDNIIQSENGNFYFYDEKSKDIGILHPKILNHLQGKENENDYYVEKIRYLEEKLNRTVGKVKFYGLDADSIKTAMANTRQIIFEVTEKCNLQCKYCGYGKLYDNYVKRTGKNLDFGTFLSVINFMKTLWESSLNLYAEQTIHISFYGGEPLMNFSFIEKVVNYLSDNPIKSKKFIYSMTTNGILLDKYQDFLVKNRFQLLISLDGNRYHNSYRAYRNGKSSFEKIISNLDKLKNKYPLFFERNVNFNSVLHNRNNVEDTSKFIFERYGKYPRVNELNVSGIAEKRQTAFNKMFQNKKNNYNNIKISGGCSFLTAKENPTYRESLRFINQTGIKYYNKNFISILKKTNEFDNMTMQTGTCIPFSRKVFVTTNNKLLPCERIGSLLDFGRIEGETVCVDFEYIAKLTNSILKKYEKKCLNCSRNTNCPICIFSDQDGYDECYKYDGNYLEFYLKEITTYLENNPGHYYNIVNNTILI